MSQRQEDNWFNRFLRALTILAVALLIIFLIATQVIRLEHLRTPSVRLTVEGEADAVAATLNQAQQVLDRANDAVSSVELVLSFLEGASVLLGLGFGAAAFYGFRSSRESREELEQEITKIERIRDQLETRLAELERYRPYLTHLEELEDNLEASQRSLEQTIDDAARLLQADQEFRLKNYETAYAFASEVLAHDPANPMALYIAGWLEVQHMQDRLDEGIAHLEKVATSQANWPTARAAYGIGIRRKARDAKGDERERLFLKAEGVLREALSHSPHLMDFEAESFWGPIGGILRELDQIDGAIQAYENAIKVTPGSSYPWGNLATLYLRKAKQFGDDPEWRARALEAFDQTLSAAHGEMVLKPNDYYLLMDIAQATMILGQEDPQHLAEAHRKLEQALNIKVSLSTLETSQRGWQDLRDNCPDDWTGVLANLDQAIAVMKQAIQTEREATSPNIRLPG